MAIHELPYLYLLPSLQSVVLLLFNYLNVYSALQNLDAGVSQIFTYKIFQVETYTKTHATASVVKRINDKEINCTKSLKSSVQYRYVLNK